MKTDTNRQRRRAYSRVQHALRTGRLVRKRCERCGSRKSEAHHDDYSKPLKVRWLCRRCHRGRHWELGMKNNPQSRHLLKPREVGEILGFKERTIAKWCREGKVKGAIKIGRVWRIPRDWRP